MRNGRESCGLQKVAAYAPEELCVAQRCYVRNGRESCGLQKVAAMLLRDAMCVTYAQRVISLREVCVAEEKAVDCRR